MTAGYRSNNTSGFGPNLAGDLAYFPNQKTGRMPSGSHQGGRSYSDVDFGGAKNQHYAQSRQPMPYNSQVSFFYIYCIYKSPAVCRKKRGKIVRGGKKHYLKMTSKEKRGFKNNYGKRQHHLGKTLSRPFLKEGKEAVHASDVMSLFKWCTTKPIVDAWFTSLTLLKNS